MFSRRQLVQHWTAELSRGQVDSPRLSAEVLLAFVLGLTRMDIIIDGSLSVSDSEITRYAELMQRRLAGEPVSYLTGVKEFYSLDFQVGSGVLIPRPETELMIEWMEANIPHTEELFIADVGTGSGILAVTGVLKFPRSRAVACDVSAAALVYAQTNVRAHGVCDRVGLYRGSLLEAIHIGRIDIILANLPYVPEVTRSLLSREVMDYEPETALFAGEDGLEMYRLLADMICGAMHPGAVLLCELDMSQGQAFTGLFAGRCSRVECHKDLSGLDRLGVVVF